MARGVGFKGTKMEEVAVLLLGVVVFLIVVVWASLMLLDLTGRCIGPKFQGQEPGQDLMRLHHPLLSAPPELYQ